MATIKHGEDLKAWFDLNGCPFWKLRDSKERNGKVIASNYGKDAVEDLKDSFNRLDTNLSFFKEEGASLWLSTKKVNDTAEYYNEINVKVIPIFLQGSEGIGNINMQMQPATVNIAGEIARAKKEWDMERKLDEMEAQINAPPMDWFTRGTEIVNGLMQNPVIAGLVAKYAGVGLGTATIGEYAHDAATPLEESDDLETAIEYFNEAGFTEKEILKFAKFVKSNPGVAKEMFKNLGNA